MSNFILRLLAGRKRYVVDCLIYGKWLGIEAWVDYGPPIGGGTDENPLTKLEAIAQKAYFESANQEGVHFRIRRVR